jgi:hypothetical protein
MVYSQVPSPIAREARAAMSHVDPRSSNSELDIKMQVPMFHNKACAKFMPPNHAFWTQQQWAV